MSSVKKRSSRVRKPATKDGLEDNALEAPREPLGEGGGGAQVENVDVSAHTRNESVELLTYGMFNDFGLADLSTPEVPMLTTWNSPSKKSQTKAPPSTKNARQAKETVSDSPDGNPSRRSSSRRSLFLAVAKQVNAKGAGDAGLDVPPPPPGEPPADGSLDEDDPEGAPSKGGSSSNGCKRCTCKRSRCLKLYCDCFAAKQYCTGCSCLDCHNREENAEEVRDARQRIQARSPLAFAPKAVESTAAGEELLHRKGCRCKRSKCLKKYCECFQAGLKCGPHCKCVDCENMGPGGCNDHPGHSIEAWLLWLLVLLSQEKVAVELIEDGPGQK